MIGTLTSILVNYIANDYEKYRPCIHQLPLELRSKINREMLEISNISPDYYMDGLYHIYNDFDYTWFLHNGWLSNHWNIISGTSGLVKSHFDRHMFCDPIQLSQSEIYHFCLTQTENGSKMFFIKESDGIFFINRAFPSKSFLNNNPYIGDTVNCLYSRSHVDRYELMKNPYI